MNLQKFTALNLYVPEFQFSLTRKTKTETFQKNPIRLREFSDALKYMI